MELQTCNKGTQLRRLKGTKVKLRAQAPIAPSLATYRITEDGNLRITEDGNLRII